MYQYFSDSSPNNKIYSFKDISNNLIKANLSGILKH